MSCSSPIRANHVSMVSMGRRGREGGGVSGRELDVDKLVY